MIMIILIFVACTDEVIFGGYSQSLPGPVYLPGVSMRNPITGRGYVYSNYAWSSQYPR